MRFGLAFTGALALSLVGCSDDQPERASDAAVEPDVTAGDAAPADALTADAAPADALPGDGSVEPDAFIPPPGGEPCTSADQCPFGDCIDGACNNARPNRCIENGDADCPEGETCGGFDENYYCVRPCEVMGECPVRTRPCATNFDCATGSSCHAGRCTNNCETDRDCGEAGFCYDGACRPYPQDLWTGTTPRPLGRPGELVAGVATRRGWRTRSIARRSLATSPVPPEFLQAALEWSPMAPVSFAIPVRASRRGRATTANAAVTTSKQVGDAGTLQRSATIGKPNEPT